MSPRYDDEWVEKMLAPERLGDMTPREFLVGNGLRREQAVIDYGCGPGFFTMPAAEIVGSSGRVYAVDIEQEMLDLVESRATAAGQQNVTTVLNADGRVPLPDRIADYAICGLVLHYRPDHAGRFKMVEDIRRLLCPGGKALILERLPRDGGEPTQQVASKEVASILGRLSMEFDAPRPFREGQYIVIASRPV